MMDPAAIKEFAFRYTEAWCSHDADRVASFFAENGSLKINDAVPSMGRAAIANAARGFMTAFPDLIVHMRGLELHGEHYRYLWTLISTNSGLGGNGNRVQISAYEEWTIGHNGLIEK